MSRADAPPPAPGDSPPALPADLDARRFFEEWLPVAVEREHGAGRRFAEIPVRVELEGEAGGAWNLVARRGELEVSTGNPPRPPLVTVLQSARDWRATLVGEPGAIALRPPKSSPLDILFIDPELRQLLAQARGRLRLEVTGYNGRTWSLDIHLGDAPPPEEPDATLSLTAETFARIVDKTLLPPQAYFGGLVEIRGDAGLAMQMAMAILPRFVGMS